MSKYSCMGLQKRRRGVKKKKMIAVDKYRLLFFSQLENILMTRGKAAKGWNAGSILGFGQLLFSCLLSTL